MVLARDGTIYGRSRTSAKGFYEHHRERIALAAVRGEAKQIKSNTDAARMQSMSVAGG